DLTVEKFPLAHVTGTAPYTPGEDVIAALRKYVESGGVLLIDSCGGASAFNDSLNRSWLPKLIGDAPLDTIGSDHPLLRQSIEGMEDLHEPRLRPYTTAKAGAGQRLKFAAVGKGAIIYSPLDISTGLLGTNAWAILGYDPNYAHALAKNVVLWSFARGGK